MRGRVAACLERALPMVALVLCLGGRGAAAQERVPASEQSAAVDADSVSVRVVGAVVSRQGGLGSRRAEARRQALGRGKRALHSWLDDVLARRGTSPALATQLHAVVDREAHVLRERPLVDGSIVMVVGLPFAPLRDAGAPELAGSAP